MNARDIGVNVFTILFLWQGIAFLIAVIPLIIHMQNMTGDPSDIVFLAEWIKNWLTGMVQLPALVLSIIVDILGHLLFGKRYSQGII